LREVIPYALIKESLAIKVEDVQASEESDRIHILNTIIGNTKEQLNDNPPETHNKYSALNDSLGGKICIVRSFTGGCLKEGETEWINMLVAMSKSTSKSKMEFDFRNGWVSELTAVQAAQLMAHVPLNMEKRFYISYAKYGVEFWDAVIERIKQFNSLKTLTIFRSKVVGEEEG